MFDLRGFLTELPFGVGDLSASLLGDPEQEAVERAFKRRQEEMERLRAMSAATRPQALQSALMAFGPANDLLAKMYGEEFALDLPGISNAARIAASTGLDAPGAPQGTGLDAPGAPQGPSPVDPGTAARALRLRSRGLRGGR